MDKDYRSYLQAFHHTSRSREEDVTAVEQTFGLTLPKDYRDCLLTRGGGEGFVGKRYLVLWNANQIVPFNADYEVQTYAPGLMLFASNGAGEGFAFDLRKEGADILAVPFIGMSLEDAISIASSFTTFLHKLSQPHVKLL